MTLSGLLLFVGAFALSGSVHAEVVNEPVKALTIESTAPEVATPESTTTENIGQSLEQAPVADSSVITDESIAFKSLEQLDELARLGMPSLALRLLNQQQQHWPLYSPDWYAFERKRIVLLSALEDWQSIVDSTEKLLTNALSGEQITEQISQWFMSQQIIARLQLRQPEEALSRVRKLIWSTNSINADSNPVALWRRLVIRAYLLMRADDDAQRALLRYQQDYSQNNNDDQNNLNEDWRMLQARAMLRTKRPEEVLTLLADSESVMAQALRLVAAIRAHPRQTDIYVKEVEKSMSAAKLSQAELWSYRYVLYEAALRKNDIYETAVALQNLLALANPHSALGEEFNVGGDDLWSLYESIGNTTGNQFNLLLGDDTAWYNKANELQEGRPIDALGLYTVLAFNTSEVTKQEMAHKGIVGLLANDVNGLELINQLYLHGSRVSSIESLPKEVRYSLVDYALSKSETGLAARLMQSLQQPPEDQDIFKWRMRKARVLILEGEYSQGESVLAQTIAENEALTPLQIDQFMQVVFDLQAVQRHTEAIRLIDSLKEEWLDDDIRRELFFWKAESSSALEQHAVAAWLYLKSAIVADQTQAELWAQSARFKAAGSLVKAGLYDDAQTMYTELLRFIGSDSRKDFIKQEIQHIRLLRNAEKTKQKGL